MTHNFYILEPQKFDFKGAVPHVFALAAFLLITFVYFQPLFEGKKIYQGDIVNYKGMSQELMEYRSKQVKKLYGRIVCFVVCLHIRFTSYTFKSKRYADKIVSFNFPREASFVLIAFIGFYILLLVLGLHHLWQLPEH